MISVRSTCSIASKNSLRWNKILCVMGVKVEAWENEKQKDDDSDENDDGSGDDDSGDLQKSCFPGF